MTLYIDGEFICRFILACLIVLHFVYKICYTKGYSDGHVRGLSEMKKIMLMIKDAEPRDTFTDEELKE